MLKDRHVEGQTDKIQTLTLSGPHRNIFWLDIFANADYDTRRRGGLSRKRDRKRSKDRDRNKVSGTKREREGERERERERERGRERAVVVCWLLNVPGTR